MATTFKIQVLRHVAKKNATMGELYVNGQLVAMTLEKPWRDNEPFVSSIPEGDYGAILRYDKSRDGFFTIQLRDTSYRPGIQIHVGNQPSDTTGCILVGIGAKYGQSLLRDSKKAINDLKTLFYGSEIPDVCPDVTIKVRISSLRKALRFHPASDLSFSWIQEDGQWVTSGGTKTILYADVFRDTKWIVLKQEGAAYVRWSTLGDKPLEVSTDLISWRVISPGENILRDPNAPPVGATLAKVGAVLPQVLALYADSELGSDQSDYNADGTRKDGQQDDPWRDADDGIQDGVIHLSFDEDNPEVIEAGEEPTQDDYSDADRDSDQDVGDEGPD